MKRFLYSSVLGTLLILGACSSYPAHSPVESVSYDSVEISSDSRTITLWPTDTVNDAAGLIFYPGGVVEPDAYVTLLARVASAGHPVVIVKMPFDLAVLAPNRAREILLDYLQTAPKGATSLRWAIGGHSLGGAMAARFLAREGEQFADLRGLILLAAYPPDSDSLAESGYPVLSVWASEDGLATEGDREETQQLLPVDATVVVIDGGNHSGFGEYGPQKGDGNRTIPLEDQHEQITRLIVAFLRDL